jgi:hypothetical protein
MERRTAGDGIGAAREARSFSLLALLEPNAYVCSTSAAARPCGVAPGASCTCARVSAFKESLSDKSSASARPAHALELPAVGSTAAQRRAASA